MMLLQAVGWLILLKCTTIETIIENSDNLTVESDAPHAGDQGGRPVAMGAAPVIKQNVGIGGYYGGGGGYTDERPFKIEKYTSINGTRYNDEEAKSIIHAQPGSSFYRISIQAHLE